MNIELSDEDSELLWVVLALACGAALRAFDVPLANRVKQLTRTIRLNAQPQATDDTENRTK